VSPIRAADLLGLPVRLHGIQLGRPIDLLVDRDGLRAVGLDVLCGDDVHRFLPLPAAVITTAEITIRSPLLLLDEDELAFYRERAFSLDSLRGCPVERGGRPMGMLKDVAVGPSGVLAEVIVEANGHEQCMPFDETVRFRPGSRSAA
jgi:hypothetical protein